MAKRNDVMAVTGEAETVIGSGVIAKGSLSSESDILVDGSFTGDIKAGGNVTLGVNAVVRGNIKATNVTIGGDLIGNVAATGDTALHQSGRVTGDISTGQLAVAPGALLNGILKMTNHHTTPVPAEPEPEQGA
jgi:cytoskeletal protein CcmA (bactofilin family)